jgi:hypothetical protein
MITIYGTEYCHDYDLWYRILSRLRFMVPHTVMITIYGTAYFEVNKTGSVRIKVTVRHIRATIGAVEKQLVLCITGVCCSVRYPACNAHVPYCYLRPVQLYVVPHYLSNCTFLKNVIKHTVCVFYFFLNFFCETFLILTRIEQDMNMYMYIYLLVTYPLFL